ncbi:MAG: hypothetical protein ABI461_24080 [Polyangiaceae bacterium]
MNFQLKLRRRLGGITLATWFAAMVALGAGLLAKHVVALPRPQSALLAPAMTALRSPQEQGQWLAVHVLYSDCRCSQRVAEHLADSARPPGWSEVILWVGDDAPDPKLAKKFDLRRVTAGELSAYGVEAAPSLIVLDPEGKLRYAGGYTDRKQGPVIEDRRILDAARTSSYVEPLPLFGCAVSSRLKSELSTLPAP